ncbi:MAG: SDR family NAD(P)-dependent oxidoreductase [Thiotrichales bacterium]|nr:SDR family NAD(P)-dependent oxidoreductase [Thiotrichales bacterium]
MSILPEKSQKNIWIFAASGGIGAAYALAAKNRFPQANLIGFSRNTDCLNLSLYHSIYSFDLMDIADISQKISEIEAELFPDYILVATGWLHDSKFQPEKTFKTLEPEHLMQSYQLNAMGPILLLQAIFKRVGWKKPIKIGVLSARLGSISDNQMGGWYSYRASKAALNMLIKNMSIELKSRQSPIILFAIQPGTTDTKLSAPFQKGLPAGQLQNASVTGELLLELFTKANASIQGHLVDWQGTIIAP